MLLGRLGDAFLRRSWKVAVRESWFQSECATISISDMIKQTSLPALLTFKNNNKSPTGPRPPSNYQNSRVGLHTRTP
jgi:hypothetical protein